MAEKDKEQGIFGKAIDAITGQDEKDELKNLQEELAQAKRDAEGAKKAVRSVMDKNADTTKDKIEAEERVKELEKKLQSLTAKANQRQAKERLEKNAERRQRREESQEPDLLATHTVESGQTLSHVALKYYNHATPPYWKFLLEHNKEVLKGDERNVRTGMKLEIPELPEDLKD